MKNQTNNAFAKKPNLFIVGQPRSGTSALHYFLSQHPDIFMSEEKEPLFFCKDFHKESDAFPKRKNPFRYRYESDYLSLFALAQNERCVGESSVHYLYSKVAAREIFEFNPDAKIIIMLREPVSFLSSWHARQLVRSYENVVSFEQALALENDRKSGKNIPANCFCPSFLFYSERVKYCEQVARYFERFNKSNIKVIIFDDFKKQNEVVYKDVLDFLNVDVNFVASFGRHNVNEKPRFVKLNELVLSSSFIKATQRFVPTLLYPKMKSLAKKILWKERVRKVLVPSFRRELMQQFKPEVIKISHLLEIDLVKKWGYGQ